MQLHTTLIHKLAPSMLIASKHYSSVLQSTFCVLQFMQSSSLTYIHVDVMNVRKNNKCLSMLLPPGGGGGGGDTGASGK